MFWQALRCTVLIEEKLQSIPASVGMQQEQRLSNMVVLKSRGCSGGSKAPNLCTTSKILLRAHKAKRPLHSPEAPALIQ